MTTEELTLIATDFLRDTYGLPLEIPIKRNNRLKAVQGNYITMHDDVSVVIEIAGIMFEYADRAVLIDTLKHELIHYAMHTLDLPYEDGHPEFEAELTKHGVSSTESTFVGKVYAFKCGACGTSEETRVEKHVRLYQSYTTECCDSTVIYEGERIYNGTEVG